jgi:ribosome-binding factor A
MTASAGRKARVADAIRDTLSEMIAREVKDPRVSAAGVVSITRVEMNVDLSVANVWVSVYGEDKVADRAIDGLKAAAGFLRGPLGRKLRLMRPPELRFQRDTGLAFGLELTRIVREDEAKARAAAASAPDPDETRDEDEQDE